MNDNSYKTIRNSGKNLGYGFFHTFARLQKTTIHHGKQPRLRSIHRRPMRRSRRDYHEKDVRRLRHLLRRRHFRPRLRNQPRVSAALGIRSELLLLSFARDLQPLEHKNRTMSNKTKLKIGEFSKMIQNNCDPALHSKQHYTKRKY